MGVWIHLGNSSVRLDSLISSTFGDGIGFAAQIWRQRFQDMNLWRVGNSPAPTWALAPAGGGCGGLLHAHVLESSEV